ILTPPTTLCMATRKELSSTVTTAATVICHSTAFVAMSRSWRDCERPKRDASGGTVEVLEKIRCAIRRRFGRRVRIIVRADSGFAREEIMAWCEQNAVSYCWGLARNKGLSARLGKSFGGLYQGIKTRDIQVPCR